MRRPRAIVYLGCALWGIGQPITGIHLLDHGHRFAGGVGVALAAAVATGLAFATIRELRS